MSCDKLSAFTSCGCAQCAVHRFAVAKGSAVAAALTLALLADTSMPLTQEEYEVFEGSREILASLENVVMRRLRG